MTREKVRFLNTMIKRIDYFATGKLLFRYLVSDLWGLFELIDPDREDDNFVSQFHKYWDFLEEINATNDYEAYRDTVENQILKGLRSYIVDYKAKIEPAAENIEENDMYEGI